MADRRLAARRTIALALIRGGSLLRLIGERAFELGLELLPAAADPGERSASVPRQDPISPEAAAMLEPEDPVRLDPAEAVFERLVSRGRRTRRPPA